jgi:hypothetical protein
MGRGFQNVEPVFWDSSIEKVHLLKISGQSQTQSRRDAEPQSFWVKTAFSSRFLSLNLDPLCDFAPLR